MKNVDLKTVTFGIGGLEISFWHCHKSRTLASTFRKKTSFCPESCLQCLVITPLSFFLTLYTQVLTEC